MQRHNDVMTGCRYRYAASGREPFGSMQQQISAAFFAGMGKGTDG